MTMTYLFFPDYLLILNSKNSLCAHIVVEVFGNSNLVLDRLLSADRFRTKFSVALPNVTLPRATSRVGPIRL